MKKQVKKKEYTKEEINNILEENSRLKKENESMKKILNSRRFRFAEKVANTYNALVPEGTGRRKAVRVVATPARKVNAYKKRSLVRKIEKKIGRNKTVIILHSIPWDTPLRQRPHHLAKLLAKKKDVMLIYFEPDEQLKSYREISDSFITVNSWKIIFDLKHNSSNKYYFFFNNVSNVPYNDVKELKEKGYEIVYEYIDEFHEDISGSLVNQLEVWKKLPSIKPALVLASADKLFLDAKKHLKNTKILLSKNAVIVEDFDYHNFEKETIPSDLKEILKLKKPIVGYYGALAPWLDYKLIAKAVENNPDLEFVLMGVNYQDALKSLDLSKKNIHYLGPKDYKELPKYSRNFDCAIIPFKTGEIAKGTSPVKLFEYMAMGLPTVGTRDLNECKGYDYVYLAKNADEFGSMIKTALIEGKKQKVKERLLEQAKNNSWQIRVDDIIGNLK